MIQYVFFIISFHDHWCIPTHQGLLNGNPQRVGFKENDLEIFRHKVMKDIEF
jgi:hypothetical protein